MNAACCLASYLKERVRPSHETGGNSSFESWVVNRFGRRLFEMFFKPYSEKLWGISCQDLNADFADQRIRKFSLGEAVKSTFFRGGQTGTAPWSIASPIRSEGPDRCTPRWPTGSCATAAGIDLRCPVRRVVCDGFDVLGVELADGRCEPCDHVISTMPLTLLVRGLDNVPQEVQRAADSLIFRNTILVYLHVDSDACFPTNGSTFIRPICSWAGSPTFATG